MLDRTIEPAFGKIDTIDLIEPTVYHLQNGTSVFCINTGTQDILKIELVFNAGSCSSDKLLVGSSAVNMMKEGTTTRTAAEIAEAVDFFGAYLEAEVSHEESSLALFTVNKHLPSVLPILADVFMNAEYHERDFETFVLKGQQEILVNQEKVSYLCAKGFSAALYGENAPYGRSANPEDYAKLKREELQAFHADHIKGRPKYIMVSGKLNDDTLKLIDQVLGDTPRSNVPLSETPVSISAASKVHITKPDAVQNAIRIGRVLFNRTHPDFVGMQILATVLGGYFGSRLMANIREDKGYTYGIGAGIISLNQSGYLSISTEVGADVCKAALDEIYFEIERLRKDLVSHSELELVKNYMLGSILKSLDGPFHIAAKWKSYMRYGLAADAHHDLVHRIKTITPERLRELAHKYLQKEDLTQVTAGKPFE